MVLHLVVVSACMSGVAHTYMVAERLEKLCNHEKWTVKIETQGALGIENALTDEEIAVADVVLLITDIDIAGRERFDKCRYVNTGVHSFLLEPQKTMKAVKQIMLLPTIAQIKLI